MRSIRRELESQRDALTNRISTSTRSTQDDDHRREIFKDPFGMASITHDDEVVAAAVDTPTSTPAGTASAASAARKSRRRVSRFSPSPRAASAARDGSRRASGALRSHYTRHQQENL